MLNNIVAIEAGNGHTCSVQADGTGRCWGFNGFGELGDGTTTTPRSLPGEVKGLTNAVAMAAGGGHTCALRADGTAACWGNNASGQLGDGTTTNQPHPVTVTAVSGVTVSNLADAVAVAAGDNHTCALRAGGSALVGPAGGTVVCWGANGFGQLGDGTTTERHIPTGVVFRVTGSFGLFFDVSLQNMVALAAGGSHSCALGANGQPFCW